MRARTLAPLLIIAGVLAQPAVVSAQVDSPTTRCARSGTTDSTWAGSVCSDLPGSSACVAVTAKSWMALA